MEKIINNLPLPYEPKKTNRYIIIFPESFKIPQWVCSKTSRPIAIISSGKIVWEPLIANVYDSIAPSTAQGLFNLISEDKLNDKFEMRIQMLDPTGEVVEEWVLLDCSFEKIDFGVLSYELDKVCEIILTIKLGKVILNF